MKKWIIPESSYKEIDLSKFILINKELLNLKRIAFKIKLNSLNEQILSVKFDISRSGFQVVSKEFILFSNYFESLANHIQRIISEYIPNLSKKIKLEKFSFLLSKALNLSSTNSVSELIKTNSFDKRIQETIENNTFFLKELQTHIQNTETLLLQAEVIFLQSKITAAYIDDPNLNLQVKDLSEEIAKLIAEIKTSIDKIKYCFGDL
jgi:hypothetical protein